MAPVFRSSSFAGVLQEAGRFFANIQTRDKKAVIRFAGAGVYALYYYGNNILYSNSVSIEGGIEYPIYIGKAVPPGSRRGVDASDSDTCFALWQRLNQHYRNIDSAENLNRDDFRFKAMAMLHPETDLISAVESYLIREYCPLWNSVVDGFGNHTPGEGRFDQAKSDWDVIHPGRKFAEKCRGKHNSEESIREKIMSWRMTI